MNPRAWLSSTLAHHIEARGEILAPWEDADETAIPVRTLATFAPLWRTEAEDKRTPVVTVEPTHGQVSAAILRHLREHGDARPTEIARSIRIGNLPSIRSILWRMVRDGKVVRVLEGRYRLV